MTKKKVIIEDFEEVLDKEAKPFGNTSHVIIAKKHEGKKATIIIGGRKVRR